MAEIAKLSLFNKVGTEAKNILEEALSPEDIEALKNADKAYRKALQDKKDKRDYAIHQAKLAILNSDKDPDEKIEINDELEDVKDQKDYWGILFSHFSVDNIFTYAILLLVVFFK